MLFFLYVLAAHSEVQINEGLDEGWEEGRGVRPGYPKIINH